MVPTKYFNWSVVRAIFSVTILFFTCFVIAEDFKTSDPSNTSYRYLIEKIQEDPYSFKLLIYKDGKRFDTLFLKSRHGAAPFSGPFEYIVDNIVGEKATIPPSNAAIVRMPVLTDDPGQLESISFIFIGKNGSEKIVDTLKKQSTRTTHSATSGHSL